MNTHTPTALTLEKIQLLLSFKQDIYDWFHRQDYFLDAAQLRSRIKQNTQQVRSIAMENNCLKLVSTAPPTQNGLTIRDYDPFNSVLDTPYYGVSFIPTIIEMIDEAIGVLESPRYSK
ncbi:hypothetical protein [Pleurocapsa sp. FMAR1]|uniref:hypothetical protein n=1 Tax=Pleurocapsa sp. FMAR1 TaxID=3040204 RepID=UPI0029C7BF13|nr:hypothetical protein [Pleurocapsa sp. FMAR1]